MRSALHLGLLGSTAAASSPLWPEPVSASLGDSTLTLSSDFAFKQGGAADSPFLGQAIERYTALIGAGAGAGAAVPSEAGVLSACSVSVQELHEDEAATLQAGVDESYSLSVDAAGVCAISAPTVFGALHGMETFTQLLQRGEGEGAVAMPYAPLAVQDSPRFTHRGMLIDTSRHFLPVAELQRLVDSLPMSKFNVLHVHLVDAQAFPVDTPSAPQMVRGAYGPSAVYSLGDLKALNEYASNRGVRLLLEVDIPGHAASWAAGYPEIMADCMDYYSNINNYALNPTLPETYEVVAKVLKDIMENTGVTTFHLGGDEVVYGCWKNDASIVAFMAEKGWTDYNDLLQYFVLKVDKISRDLGATPVHWNEVFTAGVAVEPDTIFEVWTDQSQMALIADANFTIISAPSDVWYLDHADNTWDVMYEYDPISDLSQSQTSLVLGGEVAMWGEHVDENNIESIIYPRANSVGERLWSPASVNSADAAKARFRLQRCRMIGRGFRSSDIEPGYCAQALV
jgi:hexosaminidase